MSDKIAIVNGLRGIAILVVFLVHLAGPHVPIDKGWFGAFIWTGWIGVPLFFLLSGFVLYLPFVAGKKLEILKFYQHRLARLYPLYIIAGLIGLYVYADSNTMRPSFWLHVLEMLSVSFYFTRDGMALGNGPLWSLAIEFYMSALFPMLVLGHMRFGIARLVVGLMVGTAMLKLGFIAAGLGLDWDGAHWAHRAPAMAWKLLKLLQGVTEFALGMWLCTLWQRDALKCLTPYASPLFLFSAMVLIYLVTLQPFNHEPFSLGLHALFFPAADAALALMVASALALPCGVVRGVLTCWPLQIIGAMCYSIYIWHMPMMGHLGNIEIKTTLDALIFSGFSLAAILLLAAFTYRFIEFPHKPWREVFLLPPSRKVVGRG